METMSWLAQAAGILLIGISLLDIFLTVLYARSGAGLLAPRICHCTWEAFRGLSLLAGRRRALILSLAGPVILVILATIWVLLLLFGFALIYWPALGSALQASKGPTSTDLATALYYSGFSLTTLGLGDIVPKSGPIRLLTVLEAGLGFSFFTLTITYFLSVFSALLRRNAFASIIHQKTSATGDPSLMAMRLAARRDHSGSSQQLSDLAEGAANLLESHKFYPVIHFFRFREPRYAVPRVLNILLDTVSLMKTMPLSRTEDVESSIPQLETACRDLLEEIAENFLWRRIPVKQEVSAETVAAWRRHYRKTLQELRAQGTGILPDEGRGEEAYIELRKNWHPEISKLCSNMAFDERDIVQIGA